jgi:hypothetical protein
MLKRILLPVFSIFFISNLFCQVKLNDIFNKDEILRVKNGEIISRMYLKTNPENVNTHLKIDIPKTQFTPEDYSIYEVLNDEKAFIPYKISDESKLKLYNTLTSFSKSTGMVYYSRRIAQPQTFIIFCSKVDSLKNKKNLPDSIYNEINPKIENYFIQQDNKFGKFVYKSDLYNFYDDFVMVNTCMEPMSVINSKGDTKIVSFFIYSKEDNGYFYYTVSSMRIRFGLSLITGKTNATLFSNRLRASTVHLVKLLGLNWDDKLNPWDEQKLLQGFYRTY